MSGPPAFQANAFQANAFQAGYQVIAGDYSLGALSFATPTIKSNYQLTASGYSLGSPVFATPTMASGSNISVIAINPYSLGALAFTTPNLRVSQKLTAPSYSLGPLDFSMPAIVTQTHRFTTNAFALGGLDFGNARLVLNRQLDAPSYSLGALEWTAPGPILVNTVCTVDHYSLGKLGFGYPCLTVTPDPNKIVWPLTYHRAVEEAAAMLRGFLDILLSSIPSSPITAERNTVRRLVSVLRANAESAIRGQTLGTQLEEIMQAADAAGANFAGVDLARQHLMAQAASRSLYTQIVFRAALIMTLGLQSKLVARIKFKTQMQCRNMMNYMHDAFDAAKAIGIDEIDVLVYQAIIAMSGALTNHLAVTELQLPRMVTYQTAFPMPSLYLAQRIYQDASRADEIADQNDVVHPAFCPTRLKVLSNAGREDRFTSDPTRNRR